MRGVLRKLRSCVNITIHRISRESDKEVTLHDVIREVFMRYPEEIEKAKQHLLFKAVALIVRRCLREQKYETEGGVQLLLPIELSDLELPGMISVPSDETGKQVSWVPLRIATPQQLDLHISYLSNGIRKDIQRLREMERLKSFIEARATADSPQKCIGDILGESALLEQSEKKKAS
jgi:hypothetical protein